MNNSDSKLLDSVQDALTEAGLTAQPLILGVSGGVDSMVLLRLFIQLQHPIIVGHVNYHTRGQDSDNDEQLVTTVCRSANIPCFIHSADHTHASGNFQDWAREKRYAFFEDLCTRHNARGIALAHHRDDQLETVLAKLYRGASLVNLHGMNPWNPPYFRPLLSRTREEILDYAHTHSVPFREDRSNQSNYYTRNWLRHTWIPELEQRFPGWKTNLLQIAQQSDELNDYLRMHYEMYRLREPQGCSFLISTLETLPLSIRKWMLLFASQEVSGETPSRTSLEPAATEIVHLQTGQSYPLSGTLRCVRDRDRLYVVSEHSSSTLSTHVFSTLNDLIQVKQTGWKASLQTKPDFGTKPPNVAFFDVPKLHFPLTLRPWKKGDKMVPLGMSGSKNISDILTDLKISTLVRHSALVLQDGYGEIICILLPYLPRELSENPKKELLKISEKVKLTPSSQQHLALRIQPTYVFSPS